MAHSSVTTQLNDEYSFLIHFDVNQAIRNKKNCIDEIFDTFKSAISHDVIREIFVNGLHTQFKKSNDFNIIQAIYQTFDSNANNVSLNIQQKSKANNYKNDKEGRNSISTQSATTAAKDNRTGIRHLQVFKIQNLICSIFSYLDFESILKCSRVNKQWMYDSYCPMSIAFISTKNMYKENTKAVKVKKVSRRHGNSYKENVFYQCFHNINRFKNVSSLQISKWHDNRKLDRYFRNFEKFRNVSKLSIEMNFDIELEILLSIIKNNKNKLKEMTINTISRQIVSKCTFLESIFLPYLVVLRLSGMYVQALKLQSTMDPEKLDGFSDIHFSKLEHLIIDNCHLGIEFWHGMGNDQANLNLSNMTHLSFVGCMINSKDEKIIKSNYIPKMVSKLDNLTHFKCKLNDDCDQTRSRNGKRVNVVNFLSLFLGLLSQGKARKVLKSLDIVLAAEWFFNVQGRRRNSSITIKADESVLNFENLEDVSISFEMCDVPSSHKVEHLDQVQLVQKILRIFCIRYESRKEVGHHTLSAVRVINHTVLHSRDTFDCVCFGFVFFLVSSFICCQ